jgi:hypothetical protein
MAITYILWSFGLFCGHWVYFVVIWYILWPFGIFVIIWYCLYLGCDENVNADDVDAKVHEDIDGDRDAVDVSERKGQAKQQLEQAGVDQACVDFFNFADKFVVPKKYLKVPKIIVNTTK